MSGFVVTTSSEYEVRHIKTALIRGGFEPDEISVSEVGR